MWKPKFLGVLTPFALFLPTTLMSQPACTTTAECAQVAVEAAARVEAAVKALNEKVDKLSARAKVDIKGGANAGSSWSGGGANPVDANASCPTGQVMTGINIHLGGTCHNQCDGDGRPISSYTIVCGVPNLSP